MKWAGAILLFLLSLATIAASTSTQPSTVPSTLPARIENSTSVLPKSAAEVSKETLFTFYAKNLRASLFSGFLTLGSFLVAVNTFVIVNLKKEVYDQRHYRERVAENRKSSPSTSFYGPLRRFSTLLVVTILLAISTAVSQLTIGVIFENSFGAIWCLSLAAVTIVMLILVLLLMWLNLQDWFKQWEEQTAKEFT